MTTTAPSVNGRVIGLAHYAGRAIVERVLDRHGATFQESVTLRAAAVADGPVQRDALLTEVTGYLKADPAEIGATIDALLSKGFLAADGARLRVTDAGHALNTTAAAETAPISARLYAGIPAEDLAIAGRVLALVTERADAELAAL
jgi:DNA-binding MarR family transcriptional regulator